MKITEIHSRIEHVPLSRPYSIAFKTVDAVQLGFIEIATDSAHTGYGSASPEAFITGETLDACKLAMASDTLAWLRGRDIRDIGGLTRECCRKLAQTPAASAAVDMALHDLFAKYLDRPLVDVLGRYHEALPTSITIGIKPLEETLKEADEYVARGFSVLKVKLGEDVEQDIARVAALRTTYGPGITLRVDPNQGYDAPAVLEFLKRTESLDVEFLEQPMPAKDIPAMRALPQAARDKLAADESLLNEASAMELACPPKACGIYNIKLMKCGGITTGRRIADIADTSGIKLMWGCMDESITSISAALHAALASPATRYLDLDGSLDLATDVVSGGFELKDGIMRTIEAPGLGVEPLKPH